MLDQDYDWILDFVNVNDERFHNELFEMVKVLPRYVYEQLKEKQKLHIDNSKYELALNKIKDEDGEKLSLNIDKIDERFFLTIKKLTEEELEKITNDNLDYEIMTLDHLYMQDDVGVYYKVELRVDDRDNINIVSTRVVNGLEDYENSFPIDYEDLIHIIETKQNIKR